MRPSLRRTLTGLVLAASPGCLFDQPCYEEHTVTAHVDEPPPTDLAFMLDQCDADPTMCFPVCTKILADKQPFQSVSKCSVVKTGSGHDVEISYDVSTGASGCPIAGRRPAGLRRYRSQARDAVGAYLARAAHFEAASVYAFVGLAHELARHDAPLALRAAAKRAALDEVRHAHAMTALSHARGARPARVVVPMPRERSFEALAIENAVEGLVGETWAAVIAYWQAQHAPDPELRATFAAIAEDELRHAELAREVATWVETKLSAAARRRVLAAQKRAVSTLARGVAKEAPVALRAIGMPASEQMRRLFRDARAQLWS